MTDRGVTGPPVVFHLFYFSVFPSFPYNKRVLLLRLKTGKFAIKLCIHNSLSCAFPRGLLPQTGITGGQSPQGPRGKAGSQSPRRGLHPGDLADTMAPSEAPGLF